MTEIYPGETKKRGIGMSDHGHRCTKLASLSVSTTTWHKCPMPGPTTGIGPEEEGDNGHTLGLGRLEAS